MHLRRLYFLLQSLLRIEQIWVTLYSLDMFKFAKLFISIFRESDSLKELIKEEKFEKVIDHCSELIKSTEDKGAKYLGFFSSRSLKMREKYISFAQFVYFLREVCLLFSL